MKKIFAVAAVFLLAGCATHTGQIPKMDFGPPAQVTFCTYLEEGVSKEDALKIYSSWNQNEGANYGIYLKTEIFEKKARVSAESKEILEDLKSVPLKAPCDRVLFLLKTTGEDKVRRGAIVAAWVLGLPIPMVLGEVNTETFTYGWVFIEDAENVKHEIHHLLGCGTHGDGRLCGQLIKFLKDYYLSGKKDGVYRIGYRVIPVKEPQFYPTWGLVDANEKGSPSVLITREEVAYELQRAKLKGAD